MTVTLDPADGELINTTEDVFVSETITASGVDLPIVLWEWEFDPPTENFEVEYDDTTLTVYYVSADGLFPFTIDYLDAANAVHTVTRWIDLPANLQDNPDIVAMTGSLINNVVWDLTVTATDSNSDQVVGNYTIKVEANYTLNRDLLVEAIDERY